MKKKILLSFLVLGLTLAASPLKGTAQFSPASVNPVQTTESVCGDNYIVRSGDNLREIASKCGVSVSEILALNGFIKNANLIYPGWILDLTGSETDPVTIPETGAATTNHAFYVVKAGDWLSYIARRLDITEEDLLAANPQIDENADLYTGQILMLPDAGDALGAAASPRVVEPGQLVTVAARGFGANSDVVIAGGPLGEAEEVMKTLKVNGDGMLRTTVGIPMDAARGQRWSFVVHEAGDATTQARTNLVYVVDTTGPEESIVYNVRLNDTLSGIAAKFGVTVDEIIAENPQLESSSIIFVGQDILIPAKEVGGQ